MEKPHDGKDVFLNHDQAVSLLERSPDPVVRAMLKLVYSYITWELLESDHRPQATLDLGYVFTILAKALAPKNLEAVLRNPEDPFPASDEL